MNDTLIFFSPLPLVFFSGPQVSSKIKQYPCISSFRYFISCLLGTLKMNGLEVAGTMDLSRHNNDKSTFLLRQCHPQVMPHMCVSLNKTNRVRLIVSSSDISEEDELHLTTKVSCGQSP